MFLLDFLYFPAIIITDVFYPNLLISFHLHQKGKAMIASSLRNFCISIFSTANSVKFAVQDKVATAVKSPVIPMALFAMTLFMFPFEPILAQGVKGLMGGWTDTVRAGIDFIMIIAVLVGVCAIFYGLKLIWDKSNERENVKTGHIIFSLAGGAALCILWFVVTVMSETVSDGQGGSIGAGAHF